MGASTISPRVRHRFGHRHSSSLRAVLLAVLLQAVPWRAEPPLNRRPVPTSPASTRSSGRASPPWTGVASAEPYVQAAQASILGSLLGAWSIDSSSSSGGVGEMMGCASSAALTCDDGGRLVGLSLSSMELTGSIPDTLWELNTLTNLNLSSNALSGPLPATIAKLRGLEYLDLSSNYLTSSIPKALGELTNLKHLDLRYNIFTDTVPQAMGNLSRLTYLDVGCDSRVDPKRVNYLTGPFPRQVTRMKGLAFLCLRGNLFNGSLPASIGSLISLTYLDLSHNQFASSIPASITGLAALSLLDLSFNLFNGSIPPAIGSLDALTYL